MTLSISQQEQHAYYSGMNQATAVGMTMAASEPEADQGTAGGKASKRKGRDMERALARGDLGALGKEVRTWRDLCGIFFVPRLCEYFTATSRILLSG